MKLSPLQLERSYVSRIHLDASRETKLARSVTVTTTTQCARHSEDPRRWMVTLNVVLKAKPEEAGAAPYTGEIDAVGFFAVDAGVPEGDVSRLVVVNGPAVLYGMVREMVASLTARGPHRPLTLPTVTFVDQTLPAPAPGPAPSPVAGQGPAAGGRAGGRRTARSARGRASPHT